MVTSWPSCSFALVAIGDRPRGRPIRGFDDASELRERDETEAAVGVANAPMAL